MKYTNWQKSYFYTSLIYYIIIVAALALSTLFRGEDSSKLSLSEALLIVGMVAIIGFGHMLASHFAKYEKDDKKK